MPAPRINLQLLSPAVRANLYKVQAQEEISPQRGTIGAEEPPKEATKKESKSTVKVKRKKKTLTPDMASDLVKSVKVSEDGNEVKIVLGVDVGGLPTAQQKGAFVGKDGRIHFFTKAKIAKAEKALIQALSPYAHYSASWGEVPIECSLEFYFPFPSGTPKKKLHKIAPHISRPDADNLAKLPLDCLTQAGFWKDDSLLCNFISRKRRTTQKTCMVIRITNLQSKFEALYKEESDYHTPTLFTAPSATKPSETNPLEDLFSSTDNTTKGN